MAISGYRRSVDTLIHLPYHRVSFIDSSVSKIGVGVNEGYVSVKVSSDRSLATSKGSKPHSQSWATYPFDGQTNVPPSMVGDETPHPLKGTRFRVIGEVGVLNSIFVPSSESLAGAEVSVTSSTGEKIEGSVLKNLGKGVLMEDELEHWILITPELKGNTKYTIKVNDKSWSFTTRAGVELPEYTKPASSKRKSLKPNHIYISNTEQKSLDDLRKRTSYFNTNSKSGYVNVLVNGKEVVTNPKAHIVNGNTFIPLRGVFEALGAKVEWENVTRQVLIRYMDKTVILQDKSKKARVLTQTSSGRPTQKEFDIPVAPFIKNGSTFIPLRFVAESIGGEVKWHQEDYTAAIIAGYQPTLGIECDSISCPSSMVSRLSRQYIPSKS